MIAPSHLQLGDPHSAGYDLGTRAWIFSSQTCEDYKPSLLSSRAVAGLAIGSVLAALALEMSERAAKTIGRIVGLDFTDETDDVPSAFLAIRSDVADGIAEAAGIADRIGGPGGAGRAVGRLLHMGAEGGSTNAHAMLRRISRDNDAILRLLAETSRAEALLDAAMAASAFAPDSHAVDLYLAHNPMHVAGLDELRSILDGELLAARAFTTVICPFSEGGDSGGLSCEKSLIHGLE